MSEKCQRKTRSSAGCTDRPAADRSRSMNTTLGGDGRVHDFTDIFHSWEILCSKTNTGRQPDVQGTKHPEELLVFNLQCTKFDHFVSHSLAEGQANVDSRV